MTGKQLDDLKVLRAQKEALRYQLQEISRQISHKLERCDHAYADCSTAFKRGAGTLEFCQICDTVRSALEPALDP